MTKRFALAAAAAALCFPSSALAASSLGVVLSVDAHDQAVQVVDRSHTVHAYRVRRSLKHVLAGDRVRYRYRRSTIGRLVVRPGRAHSVSFLGRVVRSANGRIFLRLADRRMLRVQAQRIHSAAGPRGRVARGVVVLVTETFGAGKHNGSPGVKVMPVRTTSDSGAPEIDGTVVELEANGLSVENPAGSTLHLSAAPSLLQFVSVCDTVAVTYHRGGSRLVADTLDETDDDPLAACNDDGSNIPDNPNGQDVIGNVRELTISGLTIGTANGSFVSVSAGVDLTSGFNIGDQVDVTYLQASDGTLVASDVEYNDIEAIGIASDVEPGSITILDSATNHYETFTDDPSNGTFDGINPGDEVDVSYYLSNGNPVVDSVSDLSSGG